MAPPELDSCLRRSRLRRRERWLNKKGREIPALIAFPPCPDSAPRRALRHSALLHHLLHAHDVRLGLEVVQLRSEEHTSELQSLMRNSYAVLCLKTKINQTDKCVV